MKRKEVEFDADTLVGSVEALAKYPAGNEKRTLSTKNLCLPPYQ